MNISRDIPTYIVFKKHLKTFFFSSIFHPYSHKFQKMSNVNVQIIFSITQMCNYWAKSQRRSRSNRNLNMGRYTHMHYLYKFKNATWTRNIYLHRLHLFFPLYLHCLEIIITCHSLDKLSSSKPLKIRHSPGLSHC